MLCEKTVTKFVPQCNVREANSHALRFNGNVTNALAVTLPYLPRSFRLIRAASCCCCTRVCSTSSSPATSPRANLRAAECLALANGALV